MKALSYNKKHNYILCNDGSIIVDNIQSIMFFIKKGIPLDKIFIKTLTPDIRKYNMHLPYEKKLTEKKICELPDPIWLIPEYYINLDVFTYLQNKFINYINSNNCLSQDDIEIRTKRLITEFELFKSRNYLDILKLVIYIIDTFNRHDVIWGIGRGSSVSSYLLYILGLHDVDSVKYDLKISDFIKNKG